MAAKLIPAALYLRMGSSYSSAPLGRLYSIFTSLGSFMNSTVFSPQLGHWFISVFAVTHLVPQVSQLQSKIRDSLAVIMIHQG